VVAIIASEETKTIIRRVIKKARHIILSFMWERRFYAGRSKAIRQQIIIQAGERKVGDGLAT
jgi:hypothetical protein